MVAAAPWRSFLASSERQLVAVILLLPLPVPGCLSALLSLLAESLMLFLLLR